MTAEALLPVTEVAALWRCSPDTVYRLIARGRIRTVNLGRGKAKTRIPESALEAYVKSLSTATEPPAGPANPPNPTKPRQRAA